MPPFSNRLNRVSLLALALCLSIQLSEAGSATWKLNPPSNDWNTAANWTPKTVPDTAGDVATFETSSVTDVTTTSTVPIGGIVFSANANVYHMNVNFALQGSGVINNSGVTQYFDISQGVSFSGNATAGENVTYTNNGPSDQSGSTFSSFQDHADAGGATFINNGEVAVGDLHGIIIFEGQSSAAHSTIVNNSPQGGIGGGVTFFADFSDGGDSVITAYSGAIVEFGDSANAGHATVIGDGGLITVMSAGTGGLARIELIHGGVFDIGHHGLSGVTVGSLEGDGKVQLGQRHLSIGGNGLSTSFAGTISQGGTVEKIGAETLTLSAENTYAGGTTVTAGFLLVATGKGSATGTGPVQVNAGTFGGRSNITGAVTIGSGSGTGAFLAPGINGPGTLVIRNALTFKSDGTYNCDLSLSKSKADQVVAKGVTIESGAQFALNAQGNQTLANGTVFTVLENKTRQHISGTFSNLPDHSTFSANGNTFQVNYEGGDGNDLTLTVVP